MMKKTSTETIRDLENRSASSSSDLNNIIKAIEEIDSSILKLERSFDDWAVNPRLRTKTLPSSFRAGDIEKVFNTLDDLIEMKDALAETHRLLLKLKVQSDTE